MHRSLLCTKSSTARRLCKFTSMIHNNRFIIPIIPESQQQCHYRTKSNSTPSEKFISKHKQTLQFLLRFNSPESLPSILEFIPKDKDVEMFNFLITNCVKNGNLPLAKKLFIELKKTIHEEIIDAKSKTLINRLLLTLLKHSLKTGNFSVAEAEEYFSVMEKLNGVNTLSLVTMLEIYRCAFDTDHAFQLADKYQTKIMKDASGLIISRLILIASKIGNVEERSKTGEKFLTWLKSDADIKAQTLCYESLVACHLHNPLKCLEILQHMEAKRMNLTKNLRGYFYFMFELKKFGEFSREKQRASLIGGEPGEIHVQSPITRYILTDSEFWNRIQLSSSSTKHFNDVTWQSGDGSSSLPDLLSNNALDKGNVSFEEFSNTFSSQMIFKRYVKGNQ